MDTSASGLEFTVLLERVVNTHTKIPFLLRTTVANEEKVFTRGEPVIVKYIIGLVPLDVINDIKFSNKYNPRRLKPIQRDLLMEQIGTYGLINPLVAVLKQVDPSNELNGIYLIDGRHRYNALLELDLDLKKSILQKAASVEKDERSISATHDMLEPSRYAKNTVVNYEPSYELIEGSRKASPMVPVKIYLGVGEVETIGMAVFINRGQKKLSGGEKIEKEAKAFDEAIRLQKINDEVISERKAAEQVDKADPERLICSWIVANVMNDENSDWAPIIGRWQGETMENKPKPLTANNFLTFVESMVNKTLMEARDEVQRAMELQNLNRLGTLFSKFFKWPDEVSDSDARFTPTSFLVRSFLIKALGVEMNERNIRNEGDKLLSSEISSEQWEDVATQIERLYGVFQEQTSLRVEFETIKKKLDKLDFGEPARQPLLKDLDKLRGKLWTLDTVTATLRNRLKDILQNGK